MPARPHPLRPSALRLALAGWALLALARTLARLAVTPRPPVDAALLLGRGLLATLPWIVAAPLIVALAERLRWRAGERPYTLAAHVAALAVWSVVEAAWAWFALLSTGQRMSGGPALWYVTRLDQTVFLYLSLVAVGAAVRYRGALEAARLAGTRLERGLRQARLHALALQLHPHFLFNTLNAVSELVHRDTAAAARVLAGLGELLRRSLDDDTPQEVTLEEELRILAPYLAIQRVRFGDTLRIAVEIEPAAQEARVPRLVLQPLVENAIRHGTSRRAGPGRIVVRARTAGDHLTLEVEDDGPGPPAHPRWQGIGLRNTSARWREVYGDRASLSLLPAGPRGTIARLEAPLRGEVPPLETAERYEANEPVPPVLAPQRVAAAAVVGWMAAALLGAQVDLAGARLVGAPEPLAAVLLPRLGEALLWLLLTPFVLAAAGRLARSEAGWSGLAAAHLVVGGVTCAGHLGLTLAFVNPGLGRSLVAVLLVIDLGIYAALAAAGHAWAVGALAAEQRAEADRLEGELDTARLDLLRWRLHPEVLFRSLDAIARLAPRDPAAADELTGRLGELLRRRLAARDDELLPLGGEVELLRAYVALRRDVGLPAPGLDLRLDPGAELARIPAFTLQTMAEAAGGDRAERLELDGRQEGGRLTITLRGKATVPLDSPAQDELRRRLGRAGGADAALTVRADEGDVTVTCRYPLDHRLRAVA